MEDNLTWKDEQQAVLARLYARADRFDDAFSVAQSNEGGADAYADIVEIAAATTNSTQIERAIERITLSTDWTTGRAIARVARALRRAGQVRRAAELVRRIQSPRERATALIDAIRDHPSGADWIVTTLREAREAAASISTSDVHFPMVADRESTLLAVMELNVELGAWEEASATLKAIGNLGPGACVETGDGALNCLEDGISELWTAKGLLIHAKGMLVAGNTPEAMHDLQTAFSIVRSHLHEPYVHDYQGRVDVLTSISRTYSLLALRNDATRVLSDAETLVGAIPRPSVDPWTSLRVRDAVRASCKLAAAYATNGDQERAAAWLDRSHAAVVGLPQLPSSDGRESSENVDDPSSMMRADLLDMLAWQAAAVEVTGATHKSAALLTEFSESVHSVQDAELRSDAWQSLERAFLSLRGLDRAIEVTSMPPLADPDRYQAVSELAPLILSSERPYRLADLLEAISDSYGKIELMARLAQRSSATESRHLVCKALAVIARGGEDWDRSLVLLAAQAPGTEAPASGCEKAQLHQIEKLLLQPKCEAPENLADAPQCTQPFSMTPDAHFDSTDRSS